ncbi:hypothetical protein CEW89_14050 [Celeribacter ethanolicus]|uniref:YjbF family lipoprotein n=1 Tax=Celeribacter ethanolicus TaxID=1758178 RepID=A0A291GDY5_9RHOB|nr:YjbF family lipoprotein [Celeribacter ethanolicus]ATG48579.1 hypothetical protein CEW89_14050 [Celeribacter ethanolicus]
MSVKTRIALLLGFVAVLSGCSSDPNQSALAQQFFNRSKGFEPGADFLAAQRSGAPGYVAGLQNGENAYTIFLRQTVNARGEETWISPDRLSLGMKDGMLIATRGFGDDQLAADARATRAALTSGRETVTERFVTLLTEGSTAETFAFRCQITREKREPVQLSESYTADTELFYETCRNGQMAFRNLFWVERGTRTIVQSRQWVSTETGELALRLIKP